MYKSAIVGFSYLAGLICASLFGIETDVVIGIVLVFLGVVFVMTKHKCAAMSSFSMGGGFVMLSIFLCFNYAPVVCESGTEAVITGKFIEKSYNSNDTSCYIIETEINGTKTLVSIFGEDVSASYGDEITASVRFSSFENSDYSTKAYYFSKGIFLKGFVLSEIKAKESESFSLIRLLYDYRESLISKINVSLNGDTGGLVSAMFLGEKSGLSASQKQNIKMSGLSHMTAVSGLHLSVVVTFVMIIFSSFFGERRVLRFVVLVVTLGAFAVLFKFTPSVLRASFMLLLYYSGPLFYRRSDPLNSVGAAVFIIVLFSPFAAYDVGLLLSASGTIGAGWLGGKVNKFLGGKFRRNILDRNKKTKEKLKSFFSEKSNFPEQNFQKERLLDDEATIKTPFRDSVVSSVCALACVIPLSAVYFGGVSLWSVLSGLIIQPIFTVCLGAMVLFTLTGGVFNVFLFIAGICSKAMGSVISFFGGMDFLWINMDYEFVPPLLPVVTLYFIAFFIRVRNKNARSVSVFFAFFIITAAIAFGGKTNREISTMDVISDGDGGSAVIGEEGKYTAIIAGSGKKTADELYMFLKSKLVNKIDFLDMSRVDGDISDYARLLKDFEIKLIVLSDKVKNQNEVYDFFPNAAISFENDTVLVADKSITIKDDITYINIKGTTISISDINDGANRAGIAIMDGHSEKLSPVGAINVYIDKSQKTLISQSVNAYETTVKYYFKEGGLVSEEYGK